MEMYVHHLRGMRRIEPEEIITILIGQIDAELQKLGYPRLRKENVEEPQQNVAGTPKRVGVRKGSRFPL